jgi:hypothetical protein
MDSTMILAQALGLILFIVGIGMLTRRKFVSEAIENAVQNPGTLFLMGIVALIIGALMVTTQAAWYGWQVVITLIGWAALLKGLLIILFPGSMATLYRKCAKPDMIVIWGMLVTIIGLFLVWAGFGW